MIENLSAEDALKFLKNKIEKSIDDSVWIIPMLKDLGENKFADILCNENNGKTIVIYMINEMLNEVCGTKSKA